MKAIFLILIAVISADVVIKKDTNLTTGDINLPNGNHSYLELSSGTGLKGKNG